MKTKHFTKLALALPVIGYSFAASAQISVDANNNVALAGAKDSTIIIGADRSVVINGEAVHKCEGTEANKSTKTKAATVTCDEHFIKVRDKNGNELSRFSSYAKSTVGGKEERVMLDEAYKIGSGTTGASTYSQQEQIVTETVQQKEIIVAPAAALIEPPHPANVDQRVYTPKLGTIAPQTPSITKKNTINQTKADAAYKQAEKDAQRYSDEVKNATGEVIVKTGDAVPTEVKETTVLTTTVEPRPGSETTDKQVNVETNTHVIAPAGSEQVPANQ